MKHVLKALTLDQLFSMLPIAAKVGLTEDKVISEVKIRLKKIDSEQIKERNQIVEKLVNEFILEAKEEFKKNFKGKINDNVFNKIFIKRRFEECLIQNDLNLAIRIWDENCNLIEGLNESQLIYSIDAKFEELIKKLLHIKENYESK